jgi:hypothetical protein
MDSAQLPDEAKSVARQQGRLVLVEGEVTGHAHAIRDTHARLLREPGPAATARRFLVLDAPADLRHEEHAAIDLPAGVFEVVIQREYVPAELPTGAWRRVVD